MAPEEPPEERMEKATIPISGDRELTFYRFGEETPA